MINPFGMLMFMLSVLACPCAAVQKDWNSLCYYAGSALLLGSIVFK